MSATNSARSSAKTLLNRKCIRRSPRTNPKESLRSGNSSCSSSSVDHTTRRARSSWTTTSCTSTNASRSRTSSMWRAGIASGDKSEVRTRGRLCGVRRNPINSVRRRAPVRHILVLSVVDLDRVGHDCSNSVRIATNSGELGISIRAFERSDCRLGDTDAVSNLLLRQRQIFAHAHETRKQAVVGLRKLLRTTLLRSESAAHESREQIRHRFQSIRRGGLRKSATVTNRRARQPEIAGEHKQFADSATRSLAIHPLARCSLGADSGTAVG